MPENVKNEVKRMMVVFKDGVPTCPNTDCNEPLDRDGGVMYDRPVYFNIERKGGKIHVDWSSETEADPSGSRCALCKQPLEDQGWEW